MTRPRSSMRITRGGSTTRSAVLESQVPRHNNGAPPKLQLQLRIDPRSTTARRKIEATLNKPQPVAVHPGGSEQRPPLPPEAAMPLFGLEPCQNVCVTAGGTVKFISVDPQCCCGGIGSIHYRRSRHAYTINTWTLRVDDMVWVRDTMVDATDLSALDAYKGIPRVPLLCPIVSMDDDDPHVICFLVCEWFHLKHRNFDSDETGFLILVDTRRKDILSGKGESSVRKGHMDMNPSPVTAVDELVGIDVGDSAPSSSTKSAEPTMQVSVFLAAFQEIQSYGLDRDDMLKAYSILSQDNSRRFISLLGIPKNLRKDWLLMEINKLLQDIIVQPFKLSRRWLSHLKIGYTFGSDIYQSHLDDFVSKFHTHFELIEYSIKPKVLALCLASLKNSVVSPNQSAFIKGRSIHDSFLSVRNTVRHLHRKKTPGVFIKLDITKAFDSIRWEYLLTLLKELGFPTRWCDWIAVLRSTSSSGVLLNGVPSAPIKHGRGLQKVTHSHHFSSSSLLIPFESS
ncbi:hypothetical protein U9M48_004906 [Paspalum notatum var. saurae]|uniref:Reverse transcriptase domain-containing protein n=1 Tax=Paspalum notatum var. saurae TaxID=547442 RepID=A0AAQ3SF48_PASNO